MNTGLKETVERQVRKIVLDIIAMVAPDADLSNVKADVALRDQLDMDSMDFLDIVMELRKRYKVEVPKEEYSRLATLKGCIEYLAPKLQAVAAV
jgi:acyl carrier protein